MRTIVVSCSRYVDAWHPMRFFLGMFWPEEAKRAILVTDTLAPGGIKSPFAATLDIGIDLGWCPNLLKALDVLGGDEPVLMLQEDFFLTSRVNAAAVADAERLMLADPGIGCFRLSPCPGPLTQTVIGTIGGVTYGECLPDEPYRISCQAALWRPAYLRRALGVVRATAAEWFEIDGSQRCASWPGRVLSVHRGQRPPTEYLCTAIIRGRWMRGAIEHCAKYGFALDTSKREVEK